MCKPSEAEERRCRGLLRRADGRADRRRTGKTTWSCLPRTSEANTVQGSSGIFGWGFSLQGRPITIYAQILDIPSRIALYPALWRIHNSFQSFTNDTFTFTFCRFAGQKIGSMEIVGGGGLDKEPSFIARLSVLFRCVLNQCGQRIVIQGIHAHEDSAEMSTSS